MAEEKKNQGPAQPVVTEPLSPEAPGAPAGDASVKDGPAQPGPGDVVVDFEKINELMAEQRAAARNAVEHEETPAPEAGAPAVSPEEDTRAPWEKTQDELNAEQKKPRRGRPPKAEKADQPEPGAAKPRKGRPPKADKTAHDGATPKQRDKVTERSL